MANRGRPQDHNPNPTHDSGSSSAGRHPFYHGIRCRSGKWVSEIREPNKSTRIWLGTYPTPEMAAAAYDVAALALKGKHVALNFPDSALSIMLHENPTTEEIRAAAARAAAARAPNYESGGGSMTAATETGAPGEFVDDEAIFGMPNLLRDMAEGMLITPPNIDCNPKDDSPDNSDGGSLWDHN